MSEVRRHGSRARNAIFAPLSDVGRAGQVEQRLTEAIRSGVLVEGERLPSEPELAARFGVARKTRGTPKPVLDGAVVTAALPHLAERIAHLASPE